jgi:hypothetical protein
MINITELDSASIIVVDKSSLPAFRDMLQRAMNTWPDAPAELKEFADLILDGKILQDYKSQG